MEAHVHVVFPQDPIADAGRHGRGAYVFGSAARRIKVVWKGHGRAEELGEFSRRASVHALQRHGEVERIEDTLRDLEGDLQTHEPVQRVPQDRDVEHARADLRFAE